MSNERKLNENLQDDLNKERQAVDAGRKAYNRAKVGKTANKAATANRAAAGKATASAGGKAVATGKAAAAGGPVGLIVAAIATVASSKTGRSFLAGIIVVFVIFPIIIVSALPNLLWNTIFHVDDNIDPIKDQKIEESLTGEAIEQKESEYADIISGYMTDSHEAVYEKIKVKAKADGVDFEATQANIVDSYDFLGAEQAGQMDSKYQDEQLVYDCLKKKGYSPSSALAAMSIMSYLTGSNVRYNMDGISDQGLTGDASSRVGAFKFDKNAYVKYIEKNYKDTKDPVALKNVASNANSQASFLDYILKSNLSKSAYKSFKKQSDVKKSIDVFCSSLDTLSKDSAGSLYKISNTMKSKHLVGEQKEATETSSTGDNRASDKLSAIRNKSGYPSGKISSCKKSAEAAYNKNKGKIDQVYKILVDGGLSPAAAAGILGNAWQESHWNTTVVSGDGHGSQGIVQWTGGRKKAAKNWISSQGGNFADITWQAKYVVHEIKQGSEKNSFKSFSKNVTSYTSGFWSVNAVGSYKAFAASDDPLVTTVNYCACIERCSIKAANMTNRYAGAEVILEKCGGITGSGGSGDPSNLGAGSRQMALILSAFSVKEDQIYPIDAKAENEEKAKLNLPGSGFSARKATTIHINGNKHSFLPWQRHPDPKADLEACLNGHTGDLYDVVYGDIVENDEGKKVYASVEIKPASSDKIISTVFGMDPEAQYKTEDGILLADKDTKISEVVTTTADNHMEMLYGNHDYGSGTSGSSLYGNVGGGTLGNPLGDAKWMIFVTRGSDGHWGNVPGHAKGFHDGLDMVPVGNRTPPVYAAEDGKVTVARDGGGYQKHVIILHQNGFSTLYGHLSSINVSKGQTVKKGQQIGVVGNGNGRYGYHLHFRVHKGDNGAEADNRAVSVNPETLIQKGKGFVK